MMLQAFVLSFGPQRVRCEESMIQGTLSLVLPAHNEAGNIEPVVYQALRVLPRFANAHEIIIVNDGSLDGTGEIADRLASEHGPVRVVHHERNRGYGGALKSGFAASTGDWVMLMDSDRQFDLEDLVYLTPFVDQFDMVAGYRLQRNDPSHRILFGQLFKLAMNVLFGIKVRDIDCAFKVMRGELLRSIKLESPGALISTELFVRWARAGGTWIEIGIHHYPRAVGEQSGGSWRVIFRAMRETLVLWYRLNREPICNSAGNRVEQRSGGISPRGLAAISGLVIAALALIIRLLRRH
jgi:glycosyltransferase involved in cell wall biosynthesis